MSEQPYRTFLFNYRFDGRDWGFEIKAKDADEARERVKVMSLARYEGVLVARLPVALGFVAKFTVACRNVFWEPR